MPALDDAKVIHGPAVPMNGAIIYQVNLPGGIVLTSAAAFTGDEPLTAGAIMSESGELVG